MNGGVSSTLVNESGYARIHEYCGMTCSGTNRGKRVSSWSLESFGEHWNIVKFELEF